MKTKTFQIGDIVRDNRRGTSGIVIRKYITESTGTEIIDVLLEGGEILTRHSEYMSMIVIRRDGVEINV